MRSLRFSLAVIMLSLATVAFAQNDARESTDKTASKADAPKPVAQSDAQKSFETLKTLAGVWSVSSPLTRRNPTWIPKGPRKSRCG